MHQGHRSRIGCINHSRSVHVLNSLAQRHRRAQTIQGPLCLLFLTLVLLSMVSGWQKQIGHVKRLQQAKRTFETVENSTGRAYSNDPSDEGGFLLGQSERWQEEPLFEEIPLLSLVGDRWQTVCSGRWFVADDIIHLESRGNNKAIAQASNCGPCQHCPMLILEGGSVFCAEPSETPQFDHPISTYVCCISVRKHSVLCQVDPK